MSDDSKKLDVFKKVIDALGDAITHADIKNIEDFKINLAKTIYTKHIAELNELMLETFGEEVCLNVFTNAYIEKQSSDSEPENLSEFVKYMFESFDEQEVLLEILAYFASEIEE